ncbi:MAG TPA: OmpA family protein [Burkholderiaceae bacterium]
MVGAPSVARIVTSITPQTTTSAAPGHHRRHRPRGHRVRQAIEILPWALLSLAALVLSGTAADALRKGAARPDLVAFEAAVGSDDCRPTHSAACASKVPRRYQLAADAFALDSAELPSELTGPLDTVAQGLREHGASAVRIEVHTDASGPAEARRTLTQRRAEAIKAYLVERGIDATLLHAVGMGSSLPRQAVDPYAAANRRIEIVRL